MTIGFGISSDGCTYNQLLQPNARVKAVARVYVMTSRAQIQNAICQEENSSLAFDPVYPSLGYNGK